MADMPLLLMENESNEDVLQLNLKQYAELRYVNISITFILNVNSRFYPLVFIKRQK